MNLLSNDKVVRELRRRLLRWYANHKRPLAWRESKEPYRVWVSEIMLQQTRVEQMDDYYLRFLHLFPCVADLARASEEQVLKAWEGLGYYSRARNMWKTAKKLVDERQGRLPETYDALLELPGIGPYTAAAISSIAFDRPHPVFDGNVVRVFCRLLRIEDDPRKSAIRARMIAAGEALIARDQPGDFNQALMELGACVCIPTNPRCGHSPLQDWCRAHRELDDPTQLPRKTPKKKRPHHHEIAGYLRRGDSVLVRRRPSDQMLGGLWELPGGRIHDGEKPRAALGRNLKEWLGRRPRIGIQLTEIAHGYSHFTITLSAFAATMADDPPLGKNKDWRWAEPQELEELPFDRAHRRLLDQLFAIDAAVI